MMEDKKETVVEQAEKLHDDEAHAQKKEKKNKHKEQIDQLELEVKNYKDFAKEIYNQTQTFKQKNMTFRSKEHESTLISQSNSKSNEFQSEISKLRAEIADNVNTTEQVQQ